MLTKQGKILIYNSFILSNFNYCPVVWHFCSQNSTRKIEKIQERALRFIADDYTSDFKTILNTCSTKLLHIDRMKSMACEVFKILYKSSPEYILDIINFKHVSYNFRNEKQVQIPQVRTTRYGLKSFSYEAARVWNSLPNNIRASESYNDFKRLLQAWDGPQCNCTLCSKL